MRVYSICRRVKTDNFLYEQVFFCHFETKQWTVYRGAQLNSLYLSCKCLQQRKTKFQNNWRKWLSSWNLKSAFFLPPPGCYDIRIKIINNNINESLNLRMWLCRFYRQVLDTACVTRNFLGLRSVKSLQSGWSTEFFLLENNKTVTSESLKLWKPYFFLPTKLFSRGCFSTGF